MKQSQPQNLFELEGLEQRILLSGYPFLGALSTEILDEPDSLFDTDSGVSSVEEIQLSDHDYLTISMMPPTRPSQMDFSQHYREYQAHMMI